MSMFNILRTVHKMVCSYNKNTIFMKRGIS